MRRGLLVVLAAWLLVGGCVRDTIDADVEIFGTLERFTQEEVREGGGCVLRKFRGFRGCVMTRLWYDEARAEPVLEAYLAAANGVARENVMVLYSNFTTLASGVYSAFEANTNYENWSWVLVRGGPNGKWRLEHYGQ